MRKNWIIVFVTGFLLLLFHLPHADTLSISENSTSDSTSAKSTIEEPAPIQEEDSVSAVHEQGETIVASEKPDEDTLPVNRDSLSTITKNETKTNSVSLRDTIHELDKITILDEKLDRDVLVVSKEISTIILAPEELDKLPNMGESDISRTLQLMPGISGADESSSALFIRGGTPDQNLIQYDGCTLFYLDHFYGFFSPFNTNAVKNVQLYKGGYPARYGSRASSVMIVNGTNGNKI